MWSKGEMAELQAKLKDTNLAAKYGLGTQKLKIPQESLTFDSSSKTIEMTHLQQLQSHLIQDYCTRK